MEEITFDEMWKKLSKYLKVNHALEQGFSNGKYTRILAQYAKKVTGIDISHDFYNMANTNLKDLNNVELLIMDAEKTNFPNKKFDALLSTSFHEFDLSSAQYSVDLPLKQRILKEMIRISNTIVFVEPTDYAITNELFKVFNPNERHGDRIKQSNNLIDRVMKEANYKLIEAGYSYNKDKFDSKEELQEEMLAWWADIKIPNNEEEKRSMIAKIDQILNTAGMLSELKVIEDIQYRVFRNVSN